MSSAPVLEDPKELTLMEPRHWATIVEIGAAEGDQLRLSGLGICCGRRLRLLKGGDPMILQVYGSRIGLSARLGRLVRVAEQPEPAPTRAA